MCQCNVEKGYVERVYKCRPIISYVQQFFLHLFLQGALHKLNFGSKFRDAEEFGDAYQTNHFRPCIFNQVVTNDALNFLICVWKNHILYFQTYT